MAEPICHIIYTEAAQEPSGWTDGDQIIDNTLLAS